MNKVRNPVQATLAALLLALIASCGSPASVQSDNPAPEKVSPAPAPCDCSMFPPKKGCENQCGITTGLVESVNSNSVVVSVPSIEKSIAKGTESAQIKERTFSISPAEASQLGTIKPGSRVVLTFQENNSAVKSIRELPQ